MLNIPDLEKRWLNYKIKSLLPYGIIIFSMLIITIILLNFIGLQQNKQTENQQLSDFKYIAIPANVVKKEEEISNVKENVLIVEQKNEPIIVKKQVKIPIQAPVISIPAPKKSVLKPSLSFMKEMQNSTQPYYENETSQNEISSSNEIESNHLPTTIINKEIAEKEIPQAEAIEEPTKINIRRQNTQNDLQEIIKRFKKNKNPALSLFVAKKYYELGDYHQSYNYALITNGLNRDIEASWIIFSKSLVKLGKKDLAIQTLQEYIKQSHSEGAKLLLNEITSGKFK
jgi:hypothetical protein